MVEFYSDVDLSSVLNEVRREVEASERDLPRDADKPNVHEINVSLFPILVFTKCIAYICTIILGMYLLI